jgi:hypothetical protein
MSFFLLTLFLQLYCLNLTFTHFTSTKSSKFYSKSSSSHLPKVNFPEFDVSVYYTYYIIGVPSGTYLNLRFNKATYTGDTEFNVLNSRLKGPPKAALSDLTLKQRKIASVKIIVSELPRRESFITWRSLN